MLVALRVDRGTLTLMNSFRSIGSFGTRHMSGDAMPHRWMVDAQRLCSRGLFQSAAPPVMDAANHAERHTHL
jgi:hypothetical protein